MRLRAFLLVVLLGGPAAPARGGDAPFPGSGWARADVDGAFARDNIASRARYSFGNAFQNGGMDQWCDSMPFTFPVSKDFVKDLGAASVLLGGTFNGNRQFFRDKTGAVLVNDQLELKFDTGFAMGWVARAEKAFGFYLGGSVDGQSLVTRPMHTSNTCAELKHLYNPTALGGNPYPFKVVRPSAKGLAGMEVGELWLIPVTFQIAIEPFDGAVAPANAGGIQKFHPVAYLAIGGFKTSDPTIEVYRAGPKEVSLKLHLDSVRGKNAQLGAEIGVIPATDIGTPGLEVLLSALLPDALSPTLQLFSRQIDSVLGVQASLSGTNAKGRQVLLEYTLDPTDAAQMELLGKVILGDLSALHAIKDFFAVQNLDSEGKKHDAALKRQAELAGVDDYSTKTRSGGFSLPVLFGLSRGAVWSEDHYEMRSPAVRAIDSWEVERQAGHGYVNLPLFGSVINSSRASGTQVLVDSSDAAGAVKGKPYLVYTQEYGLLRASQSAIIKAVAHADAALGGVGGGDEANPVTRLPDEVRAAPNEGRYHKGYMDLSLILGPEAIAKVLAASAAEVIRAFDRTLKGSSRALFDFILKVARIEDDGRILFDRKTLSSYSAYRTAADEDERDWLYSLACRLGRTATRLVSDLRDLRAVSDLPQLQAQALFRLASGQGSTGRSWWKEGKVSRDDFREIALQLVSPQDVSGDVLLHLDRDKTDSANYTVRYILNPKRYDDKVLQEDAKVQRGFVAPTPAFPLPL